MSWTIRKPGQGYWTRLLSGLGAGVLILFGSLWLWDTLKAYMNSVYVVAAIALLPILVFGLLVFRWTAAKERTVDFLIETDDEMKQVNWPSRREIVGSTVVVIMAIFLLVALLFDADQMFADLFAAAGVLHFGGSSIILSQTGWAQPTVWVLAGVGFGSIAFAIVRFFAIKHIIIGQLGLEQRPSTGVVLNTVMQTAIVAWFFFHSAALITGLSSIEQIAGQASVQKGVWLGVWIVAGVAVVLLAVGIDHLTLRQHGDDTESVSSPRHGKQTSGKVGVSAYISELIANAACLGAAWAVFMAIGSQIAQ